MQQSPNLNLEWVPITLNTGLSHIFVSALFAGAASRIIGTTYGKVLFEWLISNPPLNSKIGRKGSESLASMTKLRSLNLKNNDIDDESAKFFLHHTNLTELNLEGNSISSATNKLILDMLSRNKKRVSQIRPRK